MQNKTLGDQFRRMDNSQLAEWLTVLLMEQTQNIIHELDQRINGDDSNTPKLKIGESEIRELQQTIKNMLDKPTE